jgi:hypothetical protein
MSGGESNVLKSFDLPKKNIHKKERKNLVMMNFTKKMGLIILCLCMAAAMCLSVSAAPTPFPVPLPTAIEINTQYGNVSGYSNHIERTANGVQGYSEGNFVHNSADDVFYFAYVGGSTTYKVLYAHMDSANGDSEVYADVVQRSDIESNPELNFARGYDATFTMEESGFTGADYWTATYTYEWGYRAELSKMSILSGTYDGTCEE